MAKAPSTKALFRAMKKKPDQGPALIDDLPRQVKEETRDPLDYDPTPPDATTAFMREEAWAIGQHGDVIFEAAVGAGHMAKVFEEFGFRVHGCDVEDRGWGGWFTQASFFDYKAAPCRSLITNPPYNEISARDGGGRFLRHALELGFDYIAFLLNADWSAARINGFDELFYHHPPSLEYLCCWKIDFRGAGSPPQRNSFFVWDVNRPSIGPNTWARKRLYRDGPDPAQGSLF